MSDEKKFTSIKYDSYLHLDQLLDSQKLRSEELGIPAHDEMLFIVVHQVYELWFKEIIHDLHSVKKMFDEDTVDERNLGVAVNRLNRICEIQKLLIEQIRVMETMTPLDFLDFRNYLFPASGFQSFQFRVIETTLGLPSDKRITYNNSHYASVFTEAEQTFLLDLESKGSMLQSVERWLERTPFLNFEDFNFLQDYKLAVSKMISEEQSSILYSEFLDENSKQMRLKMLGDTETYFNNIFDENRHNELVAEGSLRFSYKATIAALLVNLYRDEPILQMPFNLLQKLTEIDGSLTLWRYRHAQMVLRMLGKKVGTGGSSGFDYLQQTAMRHSIFIDLQNISTLMIPRSHLPILPDHVKRALGFYYRKGA